MYGELFMIKENNVLVTFRGPQVPRWASSKYASTKLCCQIWSVHRAIIYENWL